MSKFYGRIGELNSLIDLTNKKTASMVVITGRRRIGKSRLIEEFAKKVKKYHKVFISGLPPSKAIATINRWN